MACSPNQIDANCIDYNGGCYKECGNPTDAGCHEAGMYGYVKSCPTRPIPHPRVNEGYFTPDDPAKIAALSAGGFNASRDAGLLFLPGKMSISSSTKKVLIGVSLGAILLLIVFFLCKKKSSCSSCAY